MRLYLYSVVHLLWNIARYSEIAKLTLACLHINCKRTFGTTYTINEIQERSFVFDMKLNIYIYAI